MKKRIFIGLLVVFVLMMLVGVVSAETYTLNIKGEPRTPDGKIDLMYSAGLATDQGMIESDTKIDNDNGFFEIKNAVLDTDASFNYVAPFVQGGCFLHSYRIMRKNNQFEVSDAYGSDQDILIATNNTSINLGILIEDKSNQVMVDFDAGVTFKAEDLNGNWVGENTAYRKDNGQTNSFKPHSSYNIILKSENGKEWKKTLTTGDYCEGTRIVKRGSYFVVENFPNNSFSRIGFFRNIWLSILGFRTIVIIPLLIILVVIILIIFLIFRRKKPSETLLQQGLS